VPLCIIFACRCCSDMLHVCIHVHVHVCVLMPYLCVSSSLHACVCMFTPTRACNQIHTVATRRCQSGAPHDPGSRSLEEGWGASPTSTTKRSQPTSADGHGKQPLAAPSS
jgi:hypothetical protein